MRRYLLLLLVVMANSLVPKLTTNNFIQELTNNELVFIKFYTPNCPHCIAMQSQYQLLYQQSNSSQYKIFQVDCSQDRDICTQNKIKGYPTLQLFVTGIAFQYEGPRTAVSISKWIQDLLQNQINVLPGDEIRKKIGKETFVLVGGLGEKSIRIISIASKLYDYGISYYGIQSNGFIRLYKEGSTSRQQYQTDQNFPISLVEWAFTKSRQAITEPTKQILQYAKNQKQYEIFLILLDEKDAFSTEGLSYLNQWCSKNKNVFCLRAGKDSDVYGELSQKCKAKGQKSTLALVRNTFQIGYHYPHDTITSAYLDQFYLNAKQDKIGRVIDVKRDLQAKFNFNNVVKLTHQTYNTTIESNKYVFIFYYISTCKYCIHFAQIYGKVGDHFKQINSDVVIGSIESNKDDIISKSLGIKHYPHVRLFVNGNPVIYSKQRNAESMIQFVTELTNSRLQKVSSIQQIQSKPFALVRGIDEDTHLHALAGLFKQHSIYYISQGQFTIQFHHRVVSRYDGKVKLQDISEWLQIESLPVLSSLGQSDPNKKLKNALIDHIPILTVLNKNERSSVSQLLETLEEYCLGKTKFICGYIHKDEPDYQMLNDWIGDIQNPNSALFWIDTNNSLKYRYEGQLNELTQDKLQTFVRQVQEGKIASLVKKSKTEPNEQL